MPDWFPHNLAELVVFTPLRIAFLVFAAILARLILHRLINRTVSRAIGHQPKLKFKAAQALINATTLPFTFALKASSALVPHSFPPEAPLPV